MSEDNKKQVFKMGDDLIAVVRELVQLSFLTGTNIVDHLRAVLVEKDPETGKLVPTEEYIVAYDEMVTGLNEQAMKAQQEAMGVPDTDVSSEEAN